MKTGCTYTVWLLFFWVFAVIIGTQQEPPSDTEASTSSFGWIIFLGSPILAYLTMRFVRAGDLGKAPSQSEPANPMHNDLPMLPEQFIVSDLETTGLHADQHEIIEIGAIRANRDTQVHDTFSTLVIPKGRISAEITEITGINRKMVKADGLQLEQALTKFRDFVGDLPMVAYNAEFDRAFLREACVRTGLPPFGNRVYCALKMAREAWPGRRSYRLDAICADGGYKAKSGDAHRALPDCERAMIVFAAAASALRGSF